MWRLFSVTPKFHSATPNFWLLCVALRKFRCGTRKFRCDAKEIYVEEVMIFSKIAYLHAVELMFVYIRLERCGAKSR